MKISDFLNEEKTRLDPACWPNKKIGTPKTKVKGGVRVNNCVPKESAAEGDYADGSSIKTPGSEDWKQQYQQAVMAVKNARTQQEYEAASDRAGRIKDLLASKGIQVGAVLGQQGVAEAKSPEEFLGQIRKMAAPVATKQSQVGSKFDEIYDRVEVALMSSGVVTDDLEYDIERALKSLKIKLTPSLIDKLVQELHNRGSQALDHYDDPWGDKGVAEDFNGEYDDEAGMVKNNLHTIVRVLTHLGKDIDHNENFPEWVQEKIAMIKQTSVEVMNYMISQHEMDIDPEINEMYEAMDQLAEEMAAKKGISADLVWESFEALDDNMLYETAAWRRKEGKSAKGGLNAKGVASYRRENPGSKLQTAVTTKPSKLKPGSKSAKRRKSFCARMSGVKGPAKKPNGKPTRKTLALRKWNC